MSIFLVFYIYIVKIIYPLATVNALATFDFQVQLTDELSFFTELQKLNGSKLIHDSSQEAKIKSGKTVQWPWRIDCGHCHQKPGMMLRYDADVKGRIAAFKRRKCSGAFLD